MKKTTIDTSLLPNVWLQWDTSKGRIWLNCKTGKRQTEPPKISFNWQNKDEVYYRPNTKPMFAYAKYHADIEMLELAAVTIDTTRKEGAHEWKYAGKKYFLNKNKVVYDAKGNECVETFELYQWHIGHKFKNFLQLFARLDCRTKTVSEFHKFLGATSYTIGNGRVVDVNYVWHIEDWYVKKQITKLNGKAQKLVDTLTEIELGSTDNIFKYQVPIRMGISYFERLNDGWSVLRMFDRDGDSLKENYRLYLHDDGTNRIAKYTKNGWIPSRVADVHRSYVFVNETEAIEKCSRLKYLIPLFKDKEQKMPTAITRILINALRFPEIEQFVKLGYYDFAEAIAKSSTPQADLRHYFGEQYNPKETNLWRKIALNKHQLEKVMAIQPSRYVYYGNWSNNFQALRKMKELFGDKLIHLDNKTFDTYYTEISYILQSVWIFFNNLERLGVDNDKKIIMNAIRLGQKNQNVYQVMKDTMYDYICLRTGTQPEIDWCFDSYSDVVRAHDAIGALREEQRQAQRALWDADAKKRQEKEEELRIKLDAERKKYEYKDDNYIIRLPLNRNEIITEGSTQRICIGGYVSSHSLGHCTLFFIRKKDAPDTPFYAIELNSSNTVNQIHGYGNKWLGNDPDAIPTVVRWLRKNGFKCDNKILTCKSIGYRSTNTYVEMPVVD